MNLFSGAAGAAGAALIAAYVFTAGHLPALSDYGAARYYERADVYAQYLSLIFLFLTPAAAFLAASLAFRKPVYCRVDACVARWRRWPEWVFWALLPLVFIVMNAWTDRYIVGGVPRVFDAFNYWFQAKNFALGQWCAEIPPAPEFFQFPFIIMRDGRWYGSVYPGFSMLLAIGIRAGFDWLVNPVIGGISLSLIYFAVREISNTQLARVAVVLGIFSPFFRMMNAIFMSHAAVIMWVSLAILTLWRWAKRRHAVSLWTPFLAGSALGWLYMTRPQAGAVTMPFLIVWTLYRIRPWRWKHIGVALIPMICALVFLGAYNRELTGDFMTNPRYYVDPGRRLGFGEDIGEPLAGGERSGHDWRRGIHNVKTLWQLWNAEAFGWGYLGVFGWPMFLMILAVGRRMFPAAAWIFSMSIVLNFLLYLFYFTPSPNFGPRYISASIPATLILSSIGLKSGHHWLSDAWGRRPSTAFAVLFIGCLIIVSITVTVPLQTAHYGILPATLSRELIPEPAEDSVILIPKHMMTMNVMTWNSPDLNGSIFLPMGDPDGLNTLYQAFPTRKFFQLQEPSDGMNGYNLVPLRVNTTLRGNTE